MPSPPDRVTLVPWEKVQEEERQEMMEASTLSSVGPLAPKDGFNLLDKNAVMSKHLSICSTKNTKRFALQLVMTMYSGKRMR